MGCDIHSYTEVKKNGKWDKNPEVFFNWRSYGMYGFLANVRNYSEVPPVSLPKGLPDDISIDRDRLEEAGYYHSHSYLTLAELLAVDYDKHFYDMRVMRDGNGAARARTLDEAEYTTLRKFLGEEFFNNLEDMKKLGEPDEVRIVFCFDN